MISTIILIAWIAAIVILTALTISIAIASSRCPLSQHDQNVIAFMRRTGAPRDMDRWQAWEHRAFAEMFPDDGGAR